MITGLSASDGSSRFSTAAKNASQSTWAIASWSRSGCSRRRGEPQASHRCWPARAARFRQSRQIGAEFPGVMALFELGWRQGPSRFHDALGLEIERLGERQKERLVRSHVIQHGAEKARRGGGAPDGLRTKAGDVQKPPQALAVAHNVR